MKGVRMFPKLAFLLLILQIIKTRSSPLPQYRNGKRLIQTAEDETPVWLDESEIWKLIENENNFMDITDHDFSQVINKKGFHRAHQSFQYEEFVRNAFNMMNIERVEEFLRKFSSWENRYYKFPTGIESQKWLLTQVQESLLNYAGTATVEEFQHSWPEQKTIIVRIRGSGGEGTIANETVIIGAHQDSINSFSLSASAPGADDNASGSVVLLEALRSLVAVGFAPKRTVEFQWYAAEEVGLRGSGEVAESYYANGVNVVSMVNYDVAGYDANGRREIRLVTDYVDPELTAYLGSLVDAYLDYPWSHYTCGYACSDHASFDRYGFPAARPAEPMYTPYMHKEEDTFETLALDQIMEFTKLAIGYVVEMGEPN